MLYVDKNSILSKNNNPIVLEPPRLSREQQDGASPASTPGSAPSAAFRVPPRRICSLPRSMFAAYKSCPLAALPRLPLKHNGSHRALPVRMEAAACARALSSGSPHAPSRPVIPCTTPPSFPLRRSPSRGFGDTRSPPPLPPHWLSSDVP